MRYTYRNNRIGHEGTRPGWNDSDIIYLNKHTTHTPSTQIWSTEELEPAAPEDRRYYCAMCKCPEYLNGSNTIWECSSCLQFYDTTRKLGIEYEVDERENCSVKVWEWK